MVSVAIRRIAADQGHILQGDFLQNRRLTVECYSTIVLHRLTEVHMYTIEIDFDVFKKLTTLRETETVSYNDVIRRLLNMPQSPQNTEAAPLITKQQDLTPVKSTQFEGPGAWVVKDVVFPSGTEFRATHKGRVILGRVETGALVVNGKRYETPSSAASDLTNTSVNGWIFWECKKPGSASWQMIKTFRKGS